MIESQVLLHESDQNLGGRDLDWLLLKSIASRFNEEHEVDIMKNKKTVYKMLSKGEGIPKCREALSADDTATVNQDDVGDDLDLEYEVTRDEFEGVVSSVVE